VGVNRVLPLENGTNRELETRGRKNCVRGIPHAGVTFKNVCGTGSRKIPRGVLFRTDLYWRHSRSDTLV